MSVKARIIVVVVFFAIPVCLLAQPVATGSLTGEIVDSELTPIPGVTITLEGPDAVPKTAVSDESGRYQFANVPPGTYVIRAELEGFAVALLQVEVAVGQTANVQLRLSVEPMPVPPPPPPPEPAPVVAPPEPVPVAPPEPPLGPFTIVRVFYGTDRQLIGSKTTRNNYSAARSKLTLGTCTVSIPMDHQLGNWERPTILDFGVEDQNDHVVLLSVTPHAEAEFVRRLQARVAASARKEAFVFVHGYNVTFRDAVQRTAILAYDLKFDGAPILFSWPSRGKTWKYLADEQTVEFAVPDLESFLALVANSSGATRIHLIAHSMGNRALLRALNNMRLAGHSPTNIGQTVLTAPDIDRDTFTKLVAALHDVAQRTTLYASSRDKAIKASRKVHDSPRAGEGGAQILVADGFDSVDVSAVDTSFLAHSYYAENKSVISDLFALLHDDRGPDERICLSRKKRAVWNYWIFDRCKP